MRKNEVITNKLDNEKVEKIEMKLNDNKNENKKTNKQQTHND
jgi:hypothetical protein